jgi:hypothetical protein
MNETGKVAVIIIERARSITASKLPNSGLAEGLLMSALKCLMK